MLGQGNAIDDDVVNKVVENIDDEVMRRGPPPSDEDATISIQGDTFKNTKQPCSSLAPRIFFRLGLNGLLLALLLPSLMLQSSMGFSSSPRRLRPRVGADGMVGSPPTNTLLSGANHASKPGPSLLTIYLCQRSITMVLHAEKKSSGSRSKGVYVRPSGAIERGSGFFVPGLEGPRVRLVVGMVLLSLTFVNHFMISGGGDGFQFEEGLAIGYSLLVLVQAGIEYIKEGQQGSAVPSPSKATGSASTSNMETDSEIPASESSRSSAALIQTFDDRAFDADAINIDKFNIAWAAASYLSLTAATTMILLRKDEDDNMYLAYQLGKNKPAAENTNVGIQAAFDALSKSSSGRIALPMSHPAVDTLLSSQDPRVKTAILQSISPTACWLVGSDQLLASFPSQDLQWLQELGVYVETNGSGSWEA